MFFITAKSTGRKDIQKGKIQMLSFEAHRKVFIFAQITWCFVKEFVKHKLCFVFLLVSVLIIIPFTFCPNNVYLIFMKLLIVVGLLQRQRHLYKTTPTESYFSTQMLGWVCYVRSWINSPKCRLIFAHNQYPIMLGPSSRHTFQCWYHCTYKSAVFLTGICVEK